MRNRRSPSSLARSRSRRVQWLQKRAEQHDAVPAERIWLLDRLCKAGASSGGPFGSFQARFKSLCSRPAGRHRDIFPMPLLDPGVPMPSALPTWKAKILRNFVNLVLVSLNHLAGVSCKAALPARRTAAQMDVVHRTIDRCMDFYMRLQSAADGMWEHLLPDWIPGIVKPEGPKFGNLKADAVDGIPCSGACNPLEMLPAEAKSIILDDKKLFRDAAPGMDHFEGIPESDRVEYVKLVAKQLRSGKLGLASSVRGGGTVLTVSKPGTGKLREVWHGRRVSQAAAPPPPPRHLASPTALLHLEASKERPVRVSKRDARCWFDQLSLPTHLRRWMGRPPVSLRELRDIAGFSADEAAGCMQDGDRATDMVFPVSKVWPMGFSWSSFVAQEALLACCTDAGLGPDKVLACDIRTPSSFSEVFAAATDDAMFFSTSGPGVTSQMAERFDRALLERDILKHSGKDVNDELNATCVGVSLEGGVQLATPPARCLALVVMVLAVTHAGAASAKQVHNVLSTLQWYDLLRRPKLAVYSSVYQFVQDPDDEVLRRLPASVMEELLLGLVLGVFWLADLTRQFLPLVAASDASTEYGFGASIARASVTDVRNLARLAEKRGSYVVLDGGADCSRTTGTGHQFHMSKEEFVHILSVRKRINSHINILEGEAFLLLLRWLLRSRARHASRVVILVDSAVWLGAAAKGRSSSTLSRLLRKACALQLAGDVMLHLVLVPSSENPSDEPSRGVRVRKPPTCLKPGRPRLAKLCRQRQKAYKMAAAWMASSLRAGSSSSSSCDTEQF